jgi:hypothetical protein
LFEGGDSLLIECWWLLIPSWRQATVSQNELRNAAIRAADKVGWTGAAADRKKSVFACV